MNSLSLPPVVKKSSQQKEETYQQQFLKSGIEELESGNPSLETQEGIYGLPET